MQKLQARYRPSSHLNHTSQVRVGLWFLHCPFAIVGRPSQPHRPTLRFREQKVRLGLLKSYSEFSSSTKGVRRLAVFVVQHPRTLKRKLASIRMVSGVFREIVREFTICGPRAKCDKYCAIGIQSWPTHSSRR
jgi:hypothetical protein